MSGPATLTLTGLRKRYGAREALRGVELELDGGERIAVVGPNGAGKTTLLSIVAGEQRADAGVVSLPPDQVGWVPQRGALYGRLSVAENLRLFARLTGVGDVEGAVRAMLAQTDLTVRADERVERLSGGNRQRVNVAIGLLGDPRVIVLDEPTTALDPAQRGRLWDFVAGLAERGVAALFSTHIVSEASAHADRVLVLDEGEQAFLGPPDELASLAGSPGDFEAALVAFLAGRREGSPGAAPGADAGPAGGGGVLGDGGKR
ncbi:MAG: ABC transporter ATP-binding protein [Solirubrobacteraceae bacterium]